MNSNMRRIRSTLSTRSLAGVTVPDTLLVSQAIGYAEDHTQPFLFNHVMRSWLFAAALAEVNETPHDAEVLGPRDHPARPGAGGRAPGTSCASKSRGQTRPEISRFKMGIDEERAQLVWDGVALNSTPSLALYKQPEVALCTAGTVIDWAGQGTERLTKDQVAAYSRRIPATRDEAEGSRARFAGSL